MINVKKEKDCCGCAACVQACPRKCISFDEDDKGFRYPNIDHEKCIGCNICEKVCPMINQSDSRLPIKVYAAKNPNEIQRLNSSSGGLFTLLAEYTIERGGVVFGARFDENWEVMHSYVETIDGINAFVGSKYIQSRVENSFVDVREFLKKKRLVLFTGTPCQIAGLKKFLQQDFDNLLLVDVICHGVPSPLVWRTYLNFIACGRQITGVSFRNKASGWRKFALEIKGQSVGDLNEQILLHETIDSNLFMRVFLKELSLRPSCYACTVKKGKSESDISIADFWGAIRYPEYDDDRGISLLFINSLKGKDIFNNLKLDYIEISYEDGLVGNPSIEKSSVKTRYVSRFWNLFKESGLKEVQAFIDDIRPSIISMLILYVKKIIKTILGIIGV